MQTLVYFQRHARCALEMSMENTPGTSTPDTFTPNSPSSNIISPFNPYVIALRNANFSVASGHVRIANFSLPFLQLKSGMMEIREHLPYDFLFPWQTTKATRSESDAFGVGKISILHFSLHECEPCHLEVQQLQTLIQHGAFPANVQVFQIMGGTDATALIAQELAPLLPEGAKTYLDLEEGLADRLGVVGAPATCILDEAGLVVGYRNGDVDFESPGMEVLLARITEWPKIQKTHPELKTFSEAVLAPNLTIPESNTVLWLKSIPFSAIAIIIIVATASFLTLRVFKQIRSKQQ